MTTWRHALSACRVGTHAYAIPDSSRIWYNVRQMFAFPPRSRMKIPATADPCSSRVPVTQASFAVARMQLSNIILE